jgi:pimeloyl-ACP methyl ester carboxylesterase
MAAGIARAGAPAREARMGLVLVHGRGATAEGILDLGHALALPDLALAAPQAPGMTWWPTSFLAPAAQMEPFVEQGMAAIDAAIEALAEEGLSRDRIALAGFSQGGCLALEYAARLGGLTAVFGLSAGLVGTGEADGTRDGRALRVRAEGVRLRRAARRGAGGDHRARARPAYPAGTRAGKRGGVRGAWGQGAAVGHARSRARDRAGGRRDDAGASETVRRPDAAGVGFRPGGVPMKCQPSTSAIASAVTVTMVSASSLLSDSGGA